MMQKLAYFGLAATGALAIVPAPSPITVTCNKDNTIDVTIDYDKKAEVLDFSYGTCDALTSRANFTQNAQFGWAFQLDVSSCGMDGKLRNLEYNQTASMRVGRRSGNMNLTLATFDINSFCTYTSTYKVKFDYGDVDAEAHTFASDGGTVNISFALQSYNQNYSRQANHSNAAGQMIYLGLSVTSDGFNHAANMTNATSGKVFAPQSCQVVDEHDTKYTLFAHDKDNCGNTAVDFGISYHQATNIWRFQHVLFLMGNYRKSTLALECTVVVCDMAKGGNDCQKVMRACGN